MFSRSSGRRLSNTWSPALPPGSLRHFSASGLVMTSGATGRGKAIMIAPIPSSRRDPSLPPQGTPGPTGTQFAVWLSYSSCNSKATMGVDAERLLNEMGQY